VRRAFLRSNDRALIGRCAREPGALCGLASGVPAHRAHVRQRYTVQRHTERLRHACNGDETAIDCGGSCGPCGTGLGCGVDADCTSNACQDGRCCGGVLVDCTRCALRLSATTDCSFAGDATAVANCQGFLQCLRDRPLECPVRYNPGCSEEPGGVCDTALFGGNFGPGVQQADRVLGTASCFF
jgi:hypothetical protein